MLFKKKFTGDGQQTPDKDQSQKLNISRTHHEDVSCL